LRLNGTNVGTNWTEIKSAASPTANVTYTLPPAVLPQVAMYCQPQLPVL
jgi:hypothetical protein